MVQFYKHDIAQWRGGTVTLSDRAYRLYHVIVEEIMINEGPVPLHERSLAGKANRSVRDFRAAMEELLDLGKVSVRDGFVHNSRCESELSAIRTNREHAANGGRNSAELRKKPIVLNGGEEAPLASDMKPKREEKRREEKKEKETDGFWKRFLEAYPKREGGDRPKEARRNFDRSVAEGVDPEIIIRAAGMYRAKVEGKDPKFVMQRATWLNQECFTEYAVDTSTVVPIRPTFHAMRGSPQWEAWDTYYRQTTGRGPPEGKAGGWNFPSEYPPSTEQAVSA